MDGGGIMSFKVLVIPEDPTHNSYILKPLVEKLLADAGKPNARVTVLTNPRLEGYDQAVRAIREELPVRYGHFDLWLFIPDADRATPEAMNSLEIMLEEQSVNLLCCPAQPEIEIYPCVAYRSEIGQPWKKVRTSMRMKEDHFEPLLSKHGDPRRAGGGRDIMIRESLSNMQGLYRICPELQELKDRIAKVVS